MSNPSTGFDPDGYLAAIQELAPGPARMRAMRQAIAAADQAKDAEWQFLFRHRCLQDSVFDGDEVDGMVIFPEMLAIYDANPSLHAEHQHTMMWDFKLTLENAVDFSHIPLSEIEAIDERFRARCKQLGYSLRAARYLAERRSISTGNLLPAEEYGGYAQEPEDDLKDCAACERSFDVEWALLTEQPDRARSVGAPIFDGSVQCAEVPETTFGMWIAYDTKHGAYGDALLLAKRLYPMIHNRSELLEDVGILLTFYAQVDPHTGLNLLRRELPNALACRNHWLQYHFSAGAARLFAAIPSETVSVVLPKAFPLWQSDHHYRTAELQQHFFRQAADIAEKMDARNGNHVLTEQLQMTFPPCPDDLYVAHTHGYAPQMVSIIGAVCKELPATLTLESIRNLLAADGRYSVELSTCDEESQALCMQIATHDTCYDVTFAVQAVPPLHLFHPTRPVGETVPADAAEAEAVLLCVLSFDEEPDASLQLQLQLLRMLCPDAVVYLDYSRKTMLPAEWVQLTTDSAVLPLVDALYGLLLFGDDNRDGCVLTTTGLACCGLRELEVVAEQKELLPNYYDFLCFATERFLLRGELPDADTPFTVLQRSDGTPVQCVWLPASQAKSHLAQTAGWQFHTEELGDHGDNHAVLFLYDGEAADGSNQLRPMSALTAADFEQFCYGTYVATQRKLAQLAQERFDDFAQCAKAYPDHVFACVRLWEDGESDTAWMQVQSVSNGILHGCWAEDALSAKEGEPALAAPQDVENFSVRTPFATITPANTYLRILHPETPTVE